jgi:hypothetical protein
MAKEKQGHVLCSWEAKQRRAADVEEIVVFQQNGSGERKIRGIRDYGKSNFVIKTVSIDEPLPPMLDHTGEYLPRTIQADLVLDFLTHPDLSHDLASACVKLEIPVVASGKKIRMQGIFTPPT